MSQFPHDKLDKDILELVFDDFGEIKSQRTLRGETRFIDIHFTPKKPIPADSELGLLATLVMDRLPIAFEPFRNSAKIDEIQASVVKALEIQFTGIV